MSLNIQAKFCAKVCQQELSKIAQSGHTDYSPTYLTSGDVSSLSLSLSFSLTHIASLFHIHAITLSLFYLKVFRANVSLTCVTRWLDNFFNIWPLETMKSCPKASFNCQSKFKVLPNTKYTLSKLSMAFKIFAKVVKYRQIWSQCNTSDPPLSLFLSKTPNHFTSLSLTLNPRVIVFTRTFVTRSKLVQQKPFSQRRLIKILSGSRLHKGLNQFSWKFKYSLQSSLNQYQQKFKKGPYRFKPVSV